MRWLLVCWLCTAWWAAPAVPTDEYVAPTTHPRLELLGGIQMLYPSPNQEYKSPLPIRFQVQSPDVGEMLDAFAGHWLCLLIDAVSRRCIPLGSPDLMSEQILAGNHTAQIVLADSDTPGMGKRWLESQETPFTVLSDEVFAVKMEQQRRDDLVMFGSDLAEKENTGVLEWHRQQQGDSNVHAKHHVTREVDAAGQLKQATWASEGTPTDPPLLVIGVKTKVISGFPFRQAIRETWASKENLPPKVRVLFAGCRPPADTSEELRDAIAYEKRVYGDLLTDELDCDDSYASLTVKVKEFIHLVGTDHVLRRASFVMIADEDVYVRADSVAAQLAGMGPMVNVYAGHVKDGKMFRPERDPRKRYYIPESEYPMDEFPPFAWGPHYLMSMDVAEFIADNHIELQGLRGLDDASVALWLLAIQVHPQHIESFTNLREMPCTNNVLAYADLCPSAMRIIQSNLRAGRPFCYGFNTYTWDKGDLER